MRESGFRCDGYFTCSKDEMKDELFNFISGLDTASHIDVMAVNVDGDVLEAGPYFVSPPARFYLRESSLTMEVCSAMTGPGYHANQINLLQAIEQGTSLRWNYSSMRDDTGYYEHRDFKRLQDFMQGRLMEYSRELLALPQGQRPVRTNLTMPYAMLPKRHDYLACHALGYIHENFFRSIDESKDKEPFCRAFFIWWDEGFSAEFYLKCALNLIWCHINWLPPELDAEFVYLEHALKSLELAWEARKDLPMPVPEWLEMARITRSSDLMDDLIRRFPTEINQPPAKGYRRRDVIHTLGENQWRIALPGKMHKVFNDDGSLLFWDDKKRLIRISSTRRLDHQGRPIAAMTLVHESVRELKAEWHSLPKAEYVPAYILHEELDGKDKTVFCTTLFAARDGHVVVVSMDYPEEEQKNWAVAVCDSLVAI
ncbi:MAG: hypothetical protein LBD82_07760 [Deltaproteobacteria bacterium]|jgi:hypothetical protein|nr:hypothetical protein [Deltaproteobacteria bacterium]